MNDCKMEETETDANSPQKHFNLSPSHPRNHLIAGWPVSHSGAQSVTEQQLYSRGIVREVMHSQEHKTVRHDIHRVHHETTLYATPKPPLKEQLHFDSIPPRSKLYSSLCSAKIRHISNAMQSKIKPSHSLKNATHRNPAEDVREPNISVSGLVTYKFSSIIAERSLGSHQIDRLQDMQNEISSLRRKRQCARAREKAILARGPARKRIKMMQTEQAIMKDDGGSTSEYLAQLVRSQEDNAILYNQKATKLRFIKDLMQEDGLPYENAQHIVQKIEEIHTVPPQSPRRRSLMVGEDEDEQFARRRLSAKKGRVMVRYQTFVD